MILTAYSAYRASRDKPPKPEQIQRGSSRRRLLGSAIITSSLIVATEINVESDNFEESRIQPIYLDVECPQSAPSITLGDINTYDNSTNTSSFHIACTAGDESMFDVSSISDVQYPTSVALLSNDQASDADITINAKYPGRTTGSLVPDGIIKDFSIINPLLSDYEPRAYIQNNDLPKFVIDYDRYYIDDVDRLVDVSTANYNYYFSQQQQNSHN